MTRISDLKRTGNAFWFPVGSIPCVRRELIADLINELSAEAPSVRICLHDSPEAPYHDMIIAHSGDYTYPAHRHPQKDETIHVLRGRLSIRTWDADGVGTIHQIGIDDIFRIPAGVYHSVSAISKVVVYHESKVGPFLGDADREFYTLPTAAK